MASEGFDLTAYLKRIGLGGDAEPTLAEIHRAHVSAIPFENLDPQRGVAVSLDPAVLQDKLVRRGRGGYCFEQNLLLAGALETVGATVEPMLARVRFGATPGAVLARTHLVLRVSTDAGIWHADVGFGNGTLLEPIPFGPGGPYEQAGWRFRVVQEGAELVLQTDVHGEWHDVYGFVPEPVPTADIEVSNWFTATHPRSRFVTGLIVTRQLPDGTRLSLSDWNELAFATRTPGEAQTTPVTRETVPELLDEHFGLPGFVVGADGRLARHDEH
jgi:N-hydroxyarylamine O-acetyltransferase